MAKRGYKRSWKNLLLNKRYQLAFTAVMVICTAIPMAGLGWYVMKQAGVATEVAKTILDHCEAPPSEDEIKASRARQQELEQTRGNISDPPARTPEPDKEPIDLPDEGEDIDEEKLDELMDKVDTADADKSGDDKADGAEPGKEDGAADGDEGAGEDGERPARKIQVTIDDSKMVMEPVGPVYSEAEVAAMQAKYDDCVAKQRKSRAGLEDGEKLIFRVLLGTCLFLLLALVAYGIKLTHKVAGPLYKVSLYLEKLRNNKYDTVYNLRKGDHLVEFYDHFKHAHDGLRKMQDEDIEQLQKIVSAADAANIADKSPELAAALEELKSVLKEKEDSIV